MKQKSRYRYFINQHGWLQEFWINPCGCCPYDVIYSWQNDYKRGGHSNGYSYMFDSRGTRDSFIKRMSKNWTELK